MTAEYVDTLNIGAGFMGQFEFTNAETAFAQAVELSPNNPYGQLDVAIAVLNQTSDDGLFTVVEVECLGACSNGPMIQINDDFYEDLNEKNTKEIIENIKNNKPNKVGSQTGRSSSENAE